MTDRAKRMWRFWASELPNREADWAGISSKGDGTMIFSDASYYHADDVANAVHRILGHKHAEWWKKQDAEDFALIQTIFATMGRNYSAIMWLLYVECVPGEQQAVNMLNEAQALLGRNKPMTLHVAQNIHKCAIQHTEKQIQAREKYKANQGDILADLRVLQKVTA